MCGFCVLTEDSKIIVRFFFTIDLGKTWGQFVCGRMTYWQTSCWIACWRCWVLTIARILPALFDAQYGVTISTADSHESILKFKIDQLN
jgi:hypothetical protein